MIGSGGREHALALALGCAAATAVYLMAPQLGGYFDSERTGRAIAWSAVSLAAAPAR